MNLHVRAMTVDELDYAAAHTAREEWASETRAEFESYFAHDPGGCLIAERDGRPVGIGVATLYGAAGFVGELIVEPDVRGQGVGRALLDAAVGYLCRRGAVTVYLDGVLKAVPLYERAGFRKLCRSWRYVREPGGNLPPAPPAGEVRPMAAADLPAVAAADRKLFGADRSFFLRRKLEQYPSLCKVQTGKEGAMTAYTFGRAVPELVMPGPWGVLPGCERPAALLEAVLAENPDAWVAGGVLDGCAAAEEIYRAYGFARRESSPWRMALGPDENLGRAEGLFAVASAAKG